MRTTFLKLTSLMLLLTILMPTVQASCSEKITTRLVEMKQENKGALKNTAGVGAFLVVPLLFSFTGAGIAVGGLTVAGLISRKIERNNLRSVKKLIDQAYIFQQTGDDSRVLRKLKRKVNKRFKTEITMENLVLDIIESNENEHLCGVTSIRNYARTYEVIVPIEVESK
jgi:hypothetical protein